MSDTFRQDFTSIVRALVDHRVDRVFLPFTALQQFAETISLEEKLTISLKEIISTGEQLRITQPIIHLFNSLKECALYNQYGPTETHFVTFFALPPVPNPWPALPPIGRPIANTQIYILDRYLRPVPIGIPGELHVGGVGLARGYLHRPDLTAEKFIPNPFSTQPGVRLYKTGDLARYLPDGSIEFLGRLDHQVKIRGFRIELGEIETVLSQHPAVREVVVVAREDTPGEKRLVAYLVAHQQPAPAVQELRHWLQAKLPDYMLPAAFVMLDALPLSPNGKIDRRNLPAPDTIRPQGAEAYVAPHNPVEEIMAGIWAQVLGLDQVGIHDNFFELGGHSLLATQVVARIRNAFQVELPLRRIFELPTIAELVAGILEDPQKRKKIEKIAPLLLNLAQLSDAEAEKMLNQLGSLPEKE